MADPLSLTASIITVVAVAHKVSKGIRSLKAAKGAPEGLSDLLDDVSRLEVVFEAIRNAALDHQATSPGINTLLENAQEKLTELDSLIHYSLKEAGPEQKVDRWQWLAKGKDVDRLRRQLDQVRSDLTLLISTNSFSMLQQITIRNSQRSCEQQQPCSQSVAPVSPQFQAMLENLYQKLEESQSTQAALTRVLGNVQQANLEASPSGTRASFKDHIPRPGSQMSSRSAINLSGLRFKRCCRYDCRCRCHKVKKSIRHLSWSNILGGGSVEFNGIPVLGLRCNVQSCNQSKVPFIRIKYSLPTWLALRMISIWFTSSPLYDPEFLIRIPRFVDKNNAAVEAIRNNDLQALQSCISQGLATPNDLYDSGSSLLMVNKTSEDEVTQAPLTWEVQEALLCLEKGIIIWLFQSGADIYYQAEILNTKLMKCFWRFFQLWWIIEINYHRRSPDLFEPICYVFPQIRWDEECEGAGLTELHNIVCRISGRDLDVETKARPGDINALDGDSRSPLFYAASTGNIDHARILLENGADINASTPSPIYVAIRQTHYGIVEYLLEAGALIPGSVIEGSMEDKTFHKNDEMFALFWWSHSYYHDERFDEIYSIDQLLIEHKADINYQSEKGKTFSITLAAHSALDNATASRLKLLLEHHADIELSDYKGRRALHHSVKGSNTPAFEALASHGARLDIQTNDGSTILHLAAIHTIVPTLIWAMLKVNLISINLEAKGPLGLTAFALLKMRAGRRRDESKLFPRLRKRGIWRRFETVTKEDDREIIEGLEMIMRKIQEAQGVAEEERYPPVVYEADLVDEIEDRVNPLPGAWPELC